VAQGKLLPDDVMLKIVTSKLDHLRNKVRSSLRIYPQKLIGPLCSTGSSTASRAQWARANYSTRISSSSRLCMIVRHNY
jgi:hypothetical protein